MKYVDFMAKIGVDQGETRLVEGPVLPESTAAAQCAAARADAGARRARPPPTSGLPASFRTRPCAVTARSRGDPRRARTDRAPRAPHAGADLPVARRARPGARLFFKCENFQKVGAFKARGATNAVFSLRRRRGARAASSRTRRATTAPRSRTPRARRGIPAWVVMPDNAPKVKQENVRRFGATIRFCAPNVARARPRAPRSSARPARTLVHPFDDERVIAGQGTAALELLDDVPELDIVIAPCGGGGLLSGTAIATKGVAPRRASRRRAGQRRRRGAELRVGSRRAAAGDRDHRRRTAHARCRRARSPRSARTSTRSAPAAKPAIVRRCGWCGSG